MLAEQTNQANDSPSRAEQTQALVDMLAGKYQAASRSVGHPVSPSLKSYADWLDTAHEFFREATEQELTLTYASEWMLDNYYVVRQAIRQIMKDLPPGFYDQLPKLESGRWQGFPRIYGIAHDILIHQHMLVNFADMQAILNALQNRLPLTMGELWAFPIFLRYGLIEALAYALEAVIKPKSSPNLPATDLIFNKRSDNGSGAAQDSLVLDASSVVGNAILSLRAISEQDWNAFFESVDLVDRILSQDPAEVYSRMDFKTRDLYRKEIERIALATGREEHALAEIALEMARQGAAIDGRDSTHAERRAHVGTYLLGEGRPLFEQQVGYQPRWKDSINPWVRAHPALVYVGSILLVSAALIVIFLLLLLPGIHAFSPPRQALVLVISTILVLIPALTIAVSLVNWLINLLVPPRILPKLDFTDAVSQPYQTLVVIPALITSPQEVDSLVGQIQMHFLRNPEPGLSFALLTDFGDAENEHTPDDAALEQRARAAIEALNRQYKRPDGSNPFYFFHRRRLYNPGQGKWMGWERKRGKLHEMNRLIQEYDGEIPTGLTFTTLAGELDQLKDIRYVITLDADTVLPRGAARRLVGTLAHPLNRAVFDDKTGQVELGYTVLQPRIEINPTSANHSWFTRIFAGDTGLDLYTLAVSDTYHDLFGEGIYVGKGIYDIRAFERSVAGRIPENSVLSHDLLEGLMGRAGLVTDITLIEDYPPNYFVQALRQQRWIRGDWQLLPWLLSVSQSRGHFTTIDRWKMLDNLRRSLFAPVLMLLVILGLFVLPGQPWLWMAAILISLGAPILVSAARGILDIIRGEPTQAAFRPVFWDLLRWLIAVAFLPFEAYLSLEAIFITLYRMLVSRKYLLEWTTAAHTLRIWQFKDEKEVVWPRLVPVSLLALVLMAGFWLLDWHSHPFNLVALLPVLVLWLASPAIAQAITQPVVVRRPELRPEEMDLLRRISRRTWAFFEHYVGPEDHWLPPDHYQESPAGIVAHHTSPTNIGLMLVSTLAAYDLGYLDQLGLATRLMATFETLDQLERHRGHFLNWYDTLTLKPLQPRYVSTVDSGNLAASLIVIAQACKTLPNQPIFRWELWQGYLDSLSIFKENFTDLAGSKTLGSGQKQIIDQVSAMQERIKAVQNHPEQQYTLFQEITGPFWKRLSEDLVKQVQDKESRYALETLRQLQVVANQVERQHLSVSRTIQELVPWIPLLEAPPDLLKSENFAEDLSALRDTLPYSPSLGEVRERVEAARKKIAELRSKLNGSQRDRAAQAGSWLDSLEQALSHASASAGVLLHGYGQIAQQAEKYVQQTDFTFLYHPQRRIFHIGYNLDSGQLDNNYYDLLASEARIASLVAIAKGDVPASHWLHLARPVTSIHGMRVLLSWSATMFEYLMPSLFLRSYPGTLLAESAAGAVQRQISYGKSSGVPWGISESGFYRFDASQNYQYRAFGVPGLGFKRGLGDDLVISPYSSLMAVCQDPHAVAQNAVDMIHRKLLGLYGFYEAIDFTKDRLLIGEESAVVREYMAHHQGMILLAMDNYFNNDIMVDRMHSDANIESVDLLLQEQVPLAAPLQSPYAEDVRGTQRIEQKNVEIVPWNVPVQTPIPEVHLLSNGHYSVLISNTGAGYSAWNGTDLTRWQPDSVLDPWGAWIYIQDVTDRKAADESGVLWSAGYQPIPNDPQAFQATFFAHMVTFRRTDADVTSTLEVTVCSDDPVEIRRVYVNNNSSVPRRLRLTSYGEVILSQQAADARHPAFNRLFIENEYVEELDLQIFRRRPRSENEAPIYLGHMLVLKGDREPGHAHEGDRYRFIGRDKDPGCPAALLSGGYLTGASGATLDPIFALGQEIDLGAHENAQIAYLTFAASSRDGILDLARRYQAWGQVERAFHQADIAAQSWLGQQNLDSDALKNVLQVLSALVFPFKVARAAPEVIAANTLGQPGLWRFGVSGDYPILLVELEDSRYIELVREVLQAHRYLRNRQYLFDVVILNKQQTDYGAELNGMLYRLASRVNSEQWLNQRGGIFILYADQMRPEERTLLQTAARLIVSGERGALGEQLPGYSIQVPHLPEFTPTRAAEVIPSTGVKNPPVEDEQLQFFNGYGGFSQNGREYVIRLEPGRPTPAPWVNVIGYPAFGFMVTEAGSQCTWSVNSGENRLTPWSNDPVRDPSGEALYLRDEETGEVWTPTPLPSGESIPFTVRHGAGYTQFEHESHGLEQCLRLFASPTDPVKIIQLRLKNTWDHPRRITATEYVEWVLGTTHAASQPYLIPEYDGERGCLLVTNPYNSEFGARAAFLAASKSIHGVTADRAEFLGRNGSPARPAAFNRLGLEQRITAGEDPCGVLQVHIDLPPGGEEEIYFLLGQGDDKNHTLKLVETYHDAQQVESAWQQTQAFWDQLLDAIQVYTPQPAVDLILNRWLLYQALSCRVWGRTAFYQSSGAFGFRDQLQDVLATLYIDPEIAREQILDSARHQFEEGDVLHWWHPPSGRGVRTRFSDDLLWLPYITAFYVEATGDTGILDEQVPYLHAEPLKPGEDERYGLYPQTEQGFSLLDHCQRAIKKGATEGPHKLPLIGTGDWNDGLNRVGNQGKGESIWLAWFLIDVLNRFAEMCERYRQPVPDDLKQKIEQYRAQAQAYASHIEESAWDGKWYRRAYYDDGAPLGSERDPEGKIDSIAQSWAILSGAGQPDHAHQAMQSVIEHLVRPNDRLILLFTPPFDKTPRDPGYIKGYLPGTRENGGQYTHAATWTCWAFTRMENGKQAAALYDLLNPIFQSSRQDMADSYRVEPYVICADIYSAPPYVRRGGWTWYTGSAAWMYRLGLEAILGFQVAGGADGKRLRVQPAINPDWDGFTIHYRFGKSTYHIAVSNPDHVANGVSQVTLDGKLQDADSAPLVDDGREHQVQVVMGVKVLKSSE